MIFNTFSIVNHNYMFQANGVVLANSWPSRVCFCSLHRFYTPFKFIRLMVNHCRTLLEAMELHWLQNHLMSS